MKKFKQTLAMFCCLLVLASMSGPFSITASASGASIAYRAHVACIGWQNYVYDGVMAGTEGQGLQMEKLELRLGGVGGGITVNSHIQNIGWMGEQSGGGGGSSVSTGTEGQGLRMEAITLKLYGDAEALYSIVYRVHCQDYGWMDWKRDGAVAGTVGESRRIEAIQIRLEQKSQPKPHIAYRAHVANLGWLGYIQDGATAGTVGQGLQLECLELALGGLSGNIVVTSHVQNIGWMSYQGGQHVVTGTEGQGLRMEAIRLWVQGEVANSYSIEYRTHVQNIGWQDWVRDGAIAGTEGQSLRIEAIEIRLVPKGSTTSNSNSGNTNSASSTSSFDPVWPSASSYKITCMYYYAKGGKHSCRYDYRYGMDIGGTGGNILAVEAGKEQS